MSTTTLLVRQDQLGTTRIDDARRRPVLAEGQIRVRVDSFALTSNNITYAAFGDAMNYWQFFPTGEAGWGIVPVWGFGTVTQSLHPGVAVGERLYGYWPMASRSRAAARPRHRCGLQRCGPHRAALHAVYNQYLRMRPTRSTAPAREDAQALLRPLFITSWLIDDFLADNDFFGAKTVLLSSASSKTAYGTAFQLIQRPGIEVVGLDLGRQRGFLRRPGLLHARAHLR